jgi:ferritin
MLKPNIEEALNKQLNAELFSSYLYLSMSAWFESLSFSGMANWMRVQAQEELTHAMKFFDFIHERDGKVTLVQVETPQTAWESPLDAFQAAYGHECKISGLINELVDLALQESDHAANAFLQWFVSEQVEEEASVLTIVDKLKLVGDNNVALFMLDGELGQRTAPAAGDTTGE